MRVKPYAWALVTGLHVVAGSALAQRGEPVDPRTLYEITTPGSAQKVKAGSKGTVVVTIKTKNGSHVSGEAPFKLEVSGKGVKPEKERLSLADAVDKRSVDNGVADPRFEIAFLAPSPGHGEVDAKLTFFICTEKICARQQKTVSIPVDVD
ncbi:MAG TPA: hypothetical protein VFV14_01310 [Myxococcaceae bacterium]|nr:hypothetical protein [Myxococcaceae bacterium]